MIEDIRPWRLAKQMIGLYGLQAEAEAATAVRVRAEAGDLIGMRQWLRTLEAIRQLSRSVHPSSL